MEGVMVVDQEDIMGSLNARAAPGEMVDIGGFRLHTLVQGQGAPAVVFEAGLGGFSYQFAHIQPGVAAFARVVAYDRAGQGWSECSPNPRTPEFLADELRALLRKLDIQPPYVLVGHSFGGLLTRIYAGRYPAEVAGIVLVDSSDVEQYDSIPNLDKLIGQMALGVRLMKFVSRIGLGKQLTKLSMGSAAKSLPKEDLDTFAEIASRPGHQEVMLAEFAQHGRYFGSQSEVPQSLGDTPLVAVTAGNSVSGQGKVGGMTIDQMNALHQRLQKKLGQLSTRGEQMVIPGATHLSILTQPAYATIVVDAIRRVVEMARA